MVVVCGGYKEKEENAVVGVSVWYWAIEREREDKVTRCWEERMREINVGWEVFDGSEGHVRKSHWSTKDKG